MATGGNWARHEWPYFKESLHDICPVRTSKGGRQACVPPKKGRADLKKACYNVRPIRVALKRPAEPSDTVLPSSLVRISGTHAVPHLLLPGTVKVIGNSIGASRRQHTSLDQRSNRMGSRFTGRKARPTNLEPKPNCGGPHPVNRAFSIHLNRTAISLHGYAISLHGSSISLQR